MPLRENPDLSLAPGLDRAFAELFRRMDEGREISRESFLAEFPEAADALRSFFEGDDLVRQKPRAPSVGETHVSKADGTSPESVAPTNTQQRKVRVVSDDPPPASPRDARAVRTSPLPPRFSRYRVQRLLGNGAMGAVWLAEDTQLGRLVALKVPLFTPGEGSDAEERFLREARAAAGLHHDGICRVFDAGQEDGMLYIVMEYIEGTPLSELIRQGPLSSERDAVRTIARLAAALGEAHRKGVVHRDVKSSNVLVDKSKKAFLTDFGLARRMADARVSVQGTIIGTPAYMAPEQILGELDRVGPQSDVYSLGVVMYELLTGRLPFEGDAIKLMARALTETPRPPSSIRTTLDPRLDALCMRMLARDLSERAPSMEAVVAGLAEIARNPRPMSLEPSGKTESRASGPRERTEETPAPSVAARRSLAPPPPRASLSVDRSRRSADSGSLIRGPWGVAAVSAAVCTILVLGLLLFRSPNGIVQIDVPDDVSVEFHGNTITVANEMRKIEIEPAKGHVFRVQYQGMPVVEAERTVTLQRREKRLITLRFIDEGRLEILDGAERRVASLPERKAQPAAPGTPEAPAAPSVPAAPPRERLIATVALKGIGHEVAWSPDGSQVACVTERGEVRLYRGQPLQLVRTWQAHEGQSRAFAWISDPGRLVTGGDDGFVRMWDELGEPQGEATISRAAIHFLDGSRDGRNVAAATADGKLVTFRDRPAENVALLAARESIASAAWSPDGDLLAVGGDDAILRVFQRRDGTLQAEIQGHSTVIEFIAWSPDGTKIASASQDGTVRFWDRRGTPLRTIRHPDGVWAVAWSPDGQRIATGCRDGFIRIWHLDARGDAVLAGHTRLVTSLAWHRDGDRLASVGEDGTLRLWSVVPSGASTPAPSDPPEAWPVLSEPDYDEPFDDPKSGYRVSAETQIRDGRYAFLYKTRGSWGWNSPERTPGRYALELTGRTPEHPSNRWGIKIGPENFGVQVMADGRQRIYVGNSWFDKSGMSLLGNRTYRNVPLDEGTGWNRLQAIVNEDTLYLYVNGRLVIGPLQLDRELAPSLLTLSAQIAEAPNASPENVEFDRFRLWRNLPDEFWTQFPQRNEEGAVESASVSGIVFDDLNGNGRRDGGEPPLAGMSVFADLNANGLRDENEPAADSNAEGQYALSDLPAKRLRIEADLPESTVRTGADPSHSRTADLRRGSSADHHLACFRLGTIGGLVYHDLNRNETRDRNEPSLAGWIIYLDLNGNRRRDLDERFATTDAEGRYALEGLGPGPSAPVTPAIDAGNGVLVDRTWPLRVEIQDGQARWMNNIRPIPLASGQTRSDVDWSGIVRSAAAGRLRNPFGVPDVAPIDDDDVKRFAIETFPRLKGAKDDPNAELWDSHKFPGSTKTLQGEWASRWRCGAAACKGHAGTSQIRIVGERIFVLMQESSGFRYLIEARREGNRLTGRYANLDPGYLGDTSPWIGLVVDNTRIDGRWKTDRWDLRRAVAEDASPAK